VLELVMNVMGSDGNGWDDGNVLAGTFRYDGYPTFEEWDKEFEGYCGMGSEPSDRYYMHLPVWASGNVYCNGAKAWEKEQDAIVCPDRDIFVRALEQADGWHLSTNLNELSDWAELAILNSEQLGMAFEPEQRFEQPDGSDIVFDEDILGEKRTIKTVAGPFANWGKANRLVY
jgi:hypothetical protein